MNWIISDPAFEVMPDFTSAIFLQMRTLLSNAQDITEAEAITQLSDTWTADNDARRVLWAQQQDADNQARLQEAEAQWTAEEAEPLPPQLDAVNKKLKISDFDENKKVSNSLIPWPSTFALHKIDSGEYVELWYFTPEGCKDAANSLKSTADETFGLSKVDDVVTIRSVASSTASRNVIRDQDLYW